MNIDQVMAAGNTLSWLSEQALTPGESRGERLQMAAVLLVAHGYLVEYASHLAKGQEPYDALIATARGELQLSDSHRDLFNTLVPHLTRE